MNFGGKRVVVMDGVGTKDAECSMRGDCALTHHGEFAMKHYVQSIEEERLLGVVGVEDSVDDNATEEAVAELTVAEKRKLARRKAGKVYTEL